MPSDSRTVSGRSHAESVTTATRPRRREPAEVLGAHVLDLRLDDVAEAADDGEGVLGAVHVDVHAQPRGPADDRDRIAERRERAAQRVAVEPRARHEGFRAVAEEDRLARLADAGLDAVLGRRGRRRRAPRERRDRPFEEDDESPRARVHDAGAAQDRELLLRPNERASRLACKRAGSRTAKSAVSLRAPGRPPPRRPSTTLRIVPSRGRAMASRAAAAPAAAAAPKPRRAKASARPDDACGESLEELREDRARSSPAIP